MKNIKKILFLNLVIFGIICCGSIYAEPLNISNAKTENDTIFLNRNVLENNYSMKQEKSTKSDTSISEEYLEIMNYKRTDFNSSMDETYSYPNTPINVHYKSRYYGTNLDSAEVQYQIPLKFKHSDKKLRVINI